MKEALYISSDEGCALINNIESTKDIIKKEIIELNYKDLPKEKDVNLLVGGTGTGKTYEAITGNKNFIMVVPTRQLAYEIFLEYPKITNIDTGEIHNNGNNGDKVTIYESLTKKDIDSVDTLIIDEAHFLNDEDRGTNLLEKVLYAISKKKKIVLLTATDTISDDLKDVLDIKIEELEPFKEIKRTELDHFDNFKEKVQEGRSTIIFTKYAPDEGTVKEYAAELGIDISKVDFISANVPSTERIKKQIQFRSGEIQVMISSNVLAQGVNFPAEVVMIEYNEWDDWEIVNQKIGRAGRPQYSDEAFYYLYDIPGKQVKNGKPKENISEYYSRYRGVDISEYEIQAFEIPKIDEYEDNINNIEYSQYKYSKKYLQIMIDKQIATDIEKEMLIKINEEERKLLGILESYKINQNFGKKIEFSDSILKKFGKK